jgi:gas vesicle protein
MARDNGGDKLIWFLTGAAMGAAVALLYAPQSGERTRRMLGRKVREGRDVLADHGRDIYDKGLDLYDKGEELFEKGRSVADDAAELFERGKRMVKG